MGDIVPIHSPRTFSREEAEILLPVVRRVTAQAEGRAEELQEQLKFVPAEEALRARLEMELDLVVKRWAVKMSRLGVEPRGVWLVDFDAGEGWFSWRLGDETLSFFHPYTGSQKIDAETSPELPS